MSPFHAHMEYLPMETRNKRRQRIATVSKTTQYVEYHKMCDLIKFW